jgi:hypothetical protein
MCCLDRDSGNTKFYSFDRNWNLLRHNRLGKAAPDGFTLPEPPNLGIMFDLAEMLAKDIPFARVDMYNIQGKIFFGEITFFPDSGFDVNILPEIDLLYGSMITLPNTKKQ